MEIKKRNSAQPITTSVLWLLQIMVYSVLKIFNIIARDEWIWWIWIPTTIIVWFVLNYKISKNN
jgi:hypothetical protein